MGLVTIVTAVTGSKCLQDWAPYVQHVAPGFGILLMLLISHVPEFKVKESISSWWKEEKVIKRSPQTTE